MCGGTQDKSTFYPSRPFSYQCESSLGDCAVLDGALVGGRESVAKGQKDELLRNDLEVWSRTTCVLGDELS